MHSCGLKCFYENTPIEEVKKGFKHYSDEMETLANGYANFVIGIVDLERKRTGEEPVVLIEQTLEMDYAPATQGTLDGCVIAGDLLTIVDNKTGFIKVSAYNEELGEISSQLGIYGLAAYKHYKDFYPIKRVRLIIYQERIHNISEYTLTVEELLRWERERLIPAAMNALSDNPVMWCMVRTNAKCFNLQESVLSATRHTRIIQHFPERITKPKYVQLAVCEKL